MTLTNVGFTFCIFSKYLCVQALLNLVHRMVRWFFFQNPFSLTWISFSSRHWQGHQISFRPQQFSLFSFANEHPDGPAICKWSSGFFFFLNSFKSLLFNSNVSVIKPIQYHNISWCHERAFEKKLPMPIGYVRNKSLTRNLFTLPHSGNTNSLLSTFPPPLTVLLGRAFGQRSSSFWSISLSSPSVPKPIFRVTVTAQFLPFLHYHLT